MSRRWIAAVVVCVLLAGCGGPSTGGNADGATATSSSTPGERVLAPPPDETNGTTATSATDGGSTDAGGTTGSETNASVTDATNVSMTDATSGSATNEATANETAANDSTSNATTAETAATYDRNLGYELRVSNAGPTARTVAVRVASANDSTVAFEASLDLGANESAKRDFEFPAAGIYAVTVTVGDARATDEWSVSSRDPDDALSVHVSAEGEAYLGFVAI
ncbi:hypothetical protein [Halorussus salinus]|uniref:hypothetical protein n=1 Tax=Halorussus salinus TaxID=1364935 RepID=UPI001092F4B9|nr:hypothetical protein [Halorussus salinus]